MRRDSINRVRVIYTPPEKYITQRQDIPEDERWLSRGLRTVRSILGYPGHFIGDRERHVIAMTGHEVDRLAEIIGYLEPTKLSLNNEQNDSSTIPEAGEISESVKSKLRETIGRPKYNEIVFYANSIERTYYSLKDSLSDSAHENTIIIGMNTKLSFIGAALCALHLRHIRMVYAVPAEYNPEYSKGSGEVEEHDITKFIKGANTIQAHFVQEE